MATDSRSIGNYFKDAVEKSANNKPQREQMVFNRGTGELEVKKTDDVTSADRKVLLKMTKFFNFVVQEVLEKGED